jgi:4-amino-4-deoxy-L-arabinose transferase-like glycosyltransferase
LVATYLAYRALSQVAGRRAGFLGGLVLASTPYWALIAHQSMTDMPYVAPLTSALCLIVLGLEVPAEEPAPRYGLRIAKRTFWLSISHVVLGLVLATSLPQLVYLLSRNVTLGQVGAGLRFALRADQFIAGSGGGTCGLPGNEECRAEFPVNDLFQPALGALIWAVALALLLFANRGERRLSRWYFLGAWYFVALSALAKGAPGLLLPLVITLVAVAATKRFEAFARLELPSFVLLFACVTLPWYVQAFMRHGPAFTDRLLFYDMYKRAFVHVHDTNAGDDVSFRYYLWQLGYGLFPASGLALWGFIGSFAGDDETTSARRRGEAFLALWAVLGFAMFSVSLTKFHHYALPVAPPLALLAGLELNRMLGPASRPIPPLRALVAYACAALGALLGALALAPGSLFGTLSAHAPASPLVGCLLLGAAIAATGLAARAFPSSVPSAEPAARFDAARVGLIALCSAGVCFLVGRDLFTSGAVEGPMRILNLFSYNYARSWPPSLDFEAALRAFTLVSCVLLALSVVVRLRQHVSLVFVALGVWFCAFLLDIYLLRVAPHWGQRETMLAYYTTRAGPEEPLVAYQMNWKGENFYTGNRVATFVSSGQKFKDWVADQRADGTRVLYVTTEHSRVGVLKSELGAVRRFQVLTTPELNNKFFLARVEL